MAGTTQGQAELAREVGLQPLMPRKAIEYLRGCLERSNCYLEYGSGGSTRMALRMRVPAVFSVESDLGFAEAVRQAVAADLAESGAGSRFEMLAIDIGCRRRRWGYPDGEALIRHWHHYPLQPWEILAAEGLRPDLVLVDGRFRVACVLASLLQAPAGTRILVDDYGDRVDWYGPVEAHVPLERIVGRMAVFTVPSALRDPGAVAFDLIRYSLDPR